MQSRPVIKRPLYSQWCPIARPFGCDMRYLYAFKVSEISHLLRRRAVSLFAGILPKGPYLPCVSMADRALLAGYHRFKLYLTFNIVYPIYVCQCLSYHAFMEISITAVLSASPSLWQVCFLRNITTLHSFYYHCTDINTWKTKTI